MTMRTTSSLLAVILAVPVYSSPAIAHVASMHAAIPISPIDISVKILHLAFLIIWAAGLIYLPSVFKAHLTTHGADTERVRAIERTVFFRITTPAGILTIILGIWLTVTHGFEGGWLPVKLLLVSLLVLFHLYCGRAIFQVRHDRPSHGPLFFGMLNQIAVLLVVLVVFLAVAKPI